ncbi:MAG: hypothetical protein KBT48_05910 [Firmicutes bacterium]|nr:hypothetical protein [Bacillota bacterium]
MSIFNLSDEQVMEFLKKFKNEPLEKKISPEDYEAIYGMPMDEEAVDMAIKFQPNPENYIHHSEAQEYYARVIVGSLLLLFGKEKLEKLSEEDYDDEYDESVIEQFISCICCFTEDMAISCALAKAKEFDDYFVH